MTQASRTASFVLAGALALASACAKKQVLKGDDPLAGAAHSRAPTPEVPYAGPRNPSAAPGQAGGSNAASAPAPANIDSGSRRGFQEGVDAAQRGDNARAEAAFRQVTERNPRVDLAWTNLGLVYEREGRNADAERAYRKALEVKGDQTEAWDALTRLYCRLGRAAEVETLLRARIQTYPSALGLRTALVFALIRETKLDVAANEAKKVLKADEKNIRAMQLLAQVYYRQQKLELAKMVLENARAIDPNDAATHNTLGLVELGLKDKPGALESFRQAATLKPDSAEATNNYGALLNESQDYDNAVRELELAVAAAPDFASARLNLGNAYRGKQDFARAQQQYQAVVKLKPEWPDTYFNLAILNLDAETPDGDPVGRYRQALGYFTQYRQHGGKDERVDQYEKDANKGIDREQRKRERDKRDQLKKAAQVEKAAKAPAPLAPSAAPPKTRSGTPVARPASRLSDDETPPPSRPSPKPAGSGKLGGDEK